MAEVVVRVGLTDEGSESTDSSGGLHTIDRFRC